MTEENRCVFLSISINSEMLFTSRGPYPTLSEYHICCQPEITFFDY